DSFVCDCSGTGYTGFDCGMDINECADSPCHNGGTCTNTWGGYQCSCEGPGYAGPDCGMDIDECASNPCAEGTTCTNTWGGFRCE
ncbi:MAG: hypothetical protein KC416_17715, partial [Myxococcales bacterium]|nr:hypothetical protein [Myxococcales bacterium]